MKTDATAFGHLNCPRVLSCEITESEAMSVIITMI